MVPAVACRAQAPSSSTTRELAEAWSGGQTTPRCQPRGPRGEVLGGPDARHCEWPAVPGSGALGRVTGTVHLGGGPSTLTWERPARDAADADRLIDSLGTAFARRGLRLRQCGEGEVPAGQLRTLLWEAPDLLVHLSRIAPAEGAPRLHVVATDEPAVMPTDVMCPDRARPASSPAGAPPTSPSTGGRVMVGEGLAVLMRPDALQDITRYQLRGDSVVTMVRWRTRGPVADSAEVRRMVTEALARTHGFETHGPDGRADPPTARLIVRPCYTDRCPDVPREVGDRRQPGDLVFAPAPDGTWVPAPEAQSPPGG